MNVLRPEDKRVQFIAPVAAISIKCFQEEADIRFDNKTVSGAATLKRSQSTFQAGR
jgi:hypothetical protein